MNFAEKLKSIRIEKALTQAELAELCGIATNTINRWENGVNLPLYKTIANLAKVLKVNPLSFLDSNNTNQDEIKEIQKADRYFQKIVYIEKDYIQAKNIAEKASIDLVNYAENHKSASYDPKLVELQNNYQLARHNEVLAEVQKQMISSIATDEKEHEIFLDLSAEIHKKIDFLNKTGLLRVIKYIDYCILTESENTTPEYKQLLQQSETKKE